MTVSVISAEEVRLRLSRAPALVDVRLQEDHARERLPGAVSNCVFEVSFLDRMKGLAPAAGGPIIVYGADEHSHESRMAADKLARAGYPEVLDFRGGLTAWKAAEGPVETGAAPPPEPTPPDGIWRLNPAACSIVWTGRNLLKSHHGAVGVGEGQFEVSGGRLVRGRVTVDFQRIECHDLAGTDLHDVLIAHLQSDDFFDVERHPYGVVELRRVEAIPSAAAGARNIAVIADVTLLGQTESLEFSAMFGFDDQGRAGLQATMSVDRTRWGMRYGSGRFFRRLGGHVVNDEIDLDVRLAASR